MCYVKQDRFTTCCETFGTGSLFKGVGLGAWQHLWGRQIDKQTDRTGNASRTPKNPIFRVFFGNNMWDLFMFSKKCNE